MKTLLSDIKFWIVDKAWRWFGWNLTGKPVMFCAETQYGCIPPGERAEVIPIIYRRPYKPEELQGEYSFRDHSESEFARMRKAAAKLCDTTMVLSEEDIKRIFSYDFIDDNVAVKGPFKPGDVHTVKELVEKIYSNGVAYSEPNPDYRTPEHGEQTGAYCDLNGTYQIFWDGIRKREVFICTCCKRIYDVVPQGGCVCDKLTEVEYLEEYQ